MALMDGVELLEHDHRMVEQLFRDYDAAASDRQRRGVVELMVRELSKHAALEELMVYPMAKGALPDGQQVTDERLAGHMAVKKDLAALDDLSEGDQRQDELMARLQHDVERHVADDEQRLHPDLRAAVDQQGLDELGEALEKAKRTAPTRPHPRAPDEPPALALAGPVAAIYDRLRDCLRGRPPT